MKRSSEMQGWIVHHCKRIAKTKKFPTLRQVLTRSMQFYIFTVSILCAHMYVYIILRGDRDTEFYKM